jgi:hypothetical protein
MTMTLTTMTRTTTDFPGSSEHGATQAGCDALLSSRVADCCEGLSMGKDRDQALTPLEPRASPSGIKKGDEV